MALTQISTGGIKDDAVTDAKLPANSVGNSEMKDDAVGVAELSATGTASSSTFLRGDNSWQAISTTPEGTAVLSTGETGGTKFLREDGDNSCSWQSVVGGITEIDCWRLNADIQHSSSEQWFTSNWERQDNPASGSTKLGTGVTETSGIFTFPSTGFWLMYAHWRFKNTGAEPEYHGYLQTSTDTDGTPDFYFPIDTTASFTDGTGTNYGNCTGVHVFDVTNTTHDKVRIGAWASSSSTYTSGHTNQNITYVYFIKLADT